MALPIGPWLIYAPVILKVRKHRGTPASAAPDWPDRRFDAVAMPGARTQPASAGFRDAAPRGGGQPGCNAYRAAAVARRAGSIPGTRWALDRRSSHRC